ncbi:MAG TPA: DUF305 domain-containing protein [Microvirga sp.]|jgi:uncharacterized protein (DUF305 family)|nr:DUF305 domain-containing protein [Microvirga sp.]
MKPNTILVALAVAALPALAIAQGGHTGHGSHMPASGGHGGHGSHAAAPASQADTPATKAYREANAKMHKEMDIRFTNDADADFIRGMIPHHQGAIDMAKVVLQHGKDEQTKKLAADIIREQEREIAQMREWLKKRGL